MGYAEKMAAMKTILILVLEIFLSGAVHAAEPMILTSPDFRPGDYIDRKFTCQGANTAPRLEFVNIPDEAKTLVLIVHDPDAPSGGWTHWVVFNIDPSKFEINASEFPGTDGKNDFGDKGWGGPCPPSGTHHYVFNGYALDIRLDLKEGAARSAIEKAMSGHVLAKAELIALYEKF